MRIGGLASGMDIDSIVSDLMKAERMPLQKLEQDRTWMTWQRDAYREMNTLFFNFRTQANDMKMSNIFRPRITSSTNEDLVTSSATSAASQSSYRISNVSNLATAATQVNNGSIFSDPSSVDTGKSLAELKSKFANQTGFDWKQGSVKEKTISVKAKGKQFSFALNPEEGFKSNEKEMSVKVGNTYYEVVTDQTKLTDDTVYVNTANGELNFEFKNDLEKGSEIEFKYTTDYRVDKMTTSEEGTTIKLSNQNIALGDGDDFTISINGTQKYVISSSSDPDSAPNIDLVAKDDPNKVVGTINYETGIITMNDENPIPAEAEVTVKYQYDYVSFRVGAYTENGRSDEVFNIKASQSFNSLIGEVNESDNGINMFYDKMTGQMSLTRTETGNFNGEGYNSDTYANDVNNREIITAGTFMTDQLKFAGAEETGGENAKFIINGLETSRTSNSFEISGVTFNLKKEFSNETVTVNVSNDSDAVFENIKEFVEKYNEFIGKVQDKLQEERYRDYRPLTDEQREELSDRQQELWEEKAKSGMLKSDDILSGALNDIRRDFYAPVENGEIPSMYQQLASIGITTTREYLEGGKLEIDEAKLKSAIQDDPDAINDLFTADGDSYEQKGILQRLTDSATQVIDRVNEKAGKTTYAENQYTLGKQLDDLGDRISAFEDRLIQVEDRYWRQFTAMEKAIQRMNSQSMYLMQQFGGGA